MAFAHSYLRFPAKPGDRFAPRAADQVPWQIKDLCKAYGWPTGLPGGTKIGIVELGGGRYDADVTAYWAAQALDTSAMPNVSDLSVRGATQQPDPQGADWEVALDILIIAAGYALATGKGAEIIVAWAPNDETGIQDAVKALADAGCGVISISWGMDETGWGQAGCQSMEAAAQYAISNGCMVLAASGDNDSSDGDQNGPANVDCPASCPSILGCGGTVKTADLEAVWNWNPGNADGTGTGGGFSTVFPRPSWQNGGAAGTMRMVPDVAGVADPNTGYPVFCNGAQQAVGGTSCVAPLYAGLLAACGPNRGFVTPKLWANQTAFTDITQGDNGNYRAGIGPDACTGLGAPIGSKIATVIG